MTLHKMFVGLCFWEPSILYKTKVTEKDFLDSRDSLIFKTMKDIVKEGKIPDEGSVFSRTGIPLEELFEYKSNEFIRSTENWQFYDQQIREQSISLEVKTRAEKIIKSQNPSRELVNELQELINEIQSKSLDFEIYDMKQTVKSTVDTLIERSKRNSRIIGIESGIKRLDDMTQGFQDRRLYYIGARPSQGKTALLLNFIRSCKESCGVISAESGKEELATRMLSNEGLIDSQRLVVGVFKTGEMERLGESASRLYDKNVYIYDEPNPSIDTVVNIAKQMKRRYDIKALFVDYLQCLSPSLNMSKRPYHEQVAYASKQMKMLARTLNIPVIVAAQLRRDAEGNKPQLNDLSDSTQIERDADVVVMIYNKYEEERLIDTWLLIEKNRDGRKGGVHVTFNQAYVQFKDFA